MNIYFGYLLCLLFSFVHWMQCHFAICILLLWQLILHEVADENGGHVSCMVH